MSKKKEKQHKTRWWEDRHAQEPLVKQKIAKINYICLFCFNVSLDCLLNLFCFVSMLHCQFQSNTAINGSWPDSAGVAWHHQNWQPRKQSLSCKTSQHKKNIIYACIIPCKIIVLYIYIYDTCVSSTGQLLVLFPFFEPSGWDHCAVAQACKAMSKPAPGKAQSSQDEFDEDKEMKAFEQKLKGFLDSINIQVSLGMNFMVYFWDNPTSQNMGILQ